MSLTPFLDQSWTNWARRNPAWRQRSKGGTRATTIESIQPCRLPSSLPVVFLGDISSFLTPFSFVQRDKMWVNILPKTSQLMCLILFETFDHHFATNPTCPYSISCQTSSLYFFRWERQRNIVVYIVYIRVPGKSIEHIFPVCMCIYIYLYT